MIDSDPLAKAHEFFDEAERWLDEPAPHDPERLRAQIECIRAMNARLRRVLGIRLVCIECGETSERTARGWRTYLTIDDQVATYCPACAREEFGDG